MKCFTCMYHVLTSVKLVRLLCCATRRRFIGSIVIEQNVARFLCDSTPPQPAAGVGLLCFHIVRPMPKLLALLWTYFGLAPLLYLLIVRNFHIFYQSLTKSYTVKFLQKFQSSDNHICNLFSKKAEIGVKNIFSQYGSQVHNVYDLKKII